jgi:hypothetical protein
MDQLVQESVRVLQRLTESKIEKRVSIADTH